jgi:hypothetical protein
VTTKDLDGFTLTLAGHPNYTPGSVVAVTVDGTALRVKPAAEISFHRAAGAWKAGRVLQAPGDKGPGAEGPISDAVSARHIYVYGTADSPGPEELKRRRNIATTGAEWSSPRLRLLVTFQVKADKEVTAKDLEEANLVLFGTRETNTQIARVASHLPLALNASAADYGLVFVAAVGNRYVVVNSGLPWWTGADQAKRPGYRFMPSAFRVLLSFGDYNLFKGSLETVVAEGLFDNHWKVPPPEAEKMIATGAVVIE